MELSEGDRICLREARNGQLRARICNEGWADEDGLALKAHFDDMSRRGLLTMAGQSGTKARMRGARLEVVYEATEVGLALLDALERAEAAEAALKAAGLKPPATRRRRSSRASSGAFAPGGCIVRS